MAKLERTITINAPVEKVFAYWTQPTNLPEIWPSLVEVKDVQRLPNGGNRLQGVYRMAGMRFEVTSEDTEYVTNQRTVTKVEGGIEGTITWIFQPEDGGTRLITKWEYTVPIPLLGRLADTFIVKQNEREVDLLLANLKARMEA